MRDQYLPPKVMRVASVKDLTLASGSGSVVDICLTVGFIGVQGEVAVPGGACGAPVGTPGAS